VVEADPPRRLAAAERLRRLERLASGAPVEMLAALLEAAGPRGLAPEELIRRTGWSRETLEQIGAAAGALRSSGRQSRWLAASAAGALELGLLEALREFHRREPLLEGMALEELRARVFKGAAAETVALAVERLRQSGRIRVVGNIVAQADFRIDLDSAGASQRESLLTRLRAAGPQGLTAPELTQGTEPQQAVRLLHLLLREGAVVRAGELHFHREVIDELRRGLRRLAQTQPTIGVADFKALGGLSRRSAIPLLEYFDREGFTRRVGDVRVLAEGAS
jgi:selenocysteine-specific elongation factor